MKFYINKQMFSEREFCLAQTPSFRITAFRYSTGAEAIKVENERGYFIILPFQGQQIWRAAFDGKELQMKTKMNEPRPGKPYLETYGGFLLHCGINSMGAPDGEHTQHGEIPNAEYNAAYIDVCDDYAAVGGELYYDKSFVKNYTFAPECRLYKNATVLKINVTIENRRQKAMEYMYLCHINFRPKDGTRLHYSADYKSVKFYSNGETASPEMKEYKVALRKDVTLHHTIGGAGQAYDPELCFGITAKGDAQNRAYCICAGEDTSWYVSYPSDVLPTGIRWISRTGDEDSLGMLLPATGEHLGYEHAKKHGQVKMLAPRSKLSFEIEAGVIDREKTAEILQKIEKINA